MKAFLLAAGHGTRLRPLTDTMPKCLVPIGGEPMLGIWLRYCRAQGVTEVCVNLHAGAVQVREFLASRLWGLEVRLAEEPELLGSAGTLAANRAWVAEEPSFAILYADVLTNADLTTLRETQSTALPAATLGLYAVPDPRRCGIAQVDDLGVIRNFDEKPAYPVGNLAFSGIMMAGPPLLEALPTHAPADIGSHVLPRLLGRMRAVVLHDFILDIGTPENYTLAQVTWPGLAGDGDRKSWPK